MGAGVINVDVNPGGILKAIFDGIDALFTSDEEKQQLRNDAIKAAQESRLKEWAIEAGLLTAQIEVNKVQAASGSFFDRGPRPFIMWVCGWAFALQYLVFPIANYVMASLGRPQIEIAFDGDAIMTVMLGLLGLGLAGMRSFDKKVGSAR